jgi:hypothetical protein
MESKDLYQHLLGLSTPWTVERVELDMAKQHVDVYVEHPKGTRFAWALKESLREMWGYRTKLGAQCFWKQWYFWATHSCLAPMIEKAKRLVS